MIFKKKRLDEVIIIFEKYQLKNVNVVKDDLTINYEKLILLYKELGEFAERIGGFEIKVNLSRRRALIAILQEKYYGLDDYNKEEINFDIIEKQAYSRYEIKQRDKSKFNSPQEAHPKSPNNYYGNNSYKRRHYKEAIKILACMPDLYIYDDQAIVHLKNLYFRLDD